MSAKKKLNLFISITLIVALIGFIGMMFYAPEEGLNGFIVSLAKKAVFIVAAILIVTSVIKFKSVTKTDKIGKYIAVGVLLYALIAGIAGFIAYGSLKDFKNTRSTASLTYSDYDAYYKDFGKLGALYHLNVVIEGKQRTFVITKETYESIKQVSQIDIEYYPNNNVIYSISYNQSASVNTNTYSSPSNIANEFYDVTDSTDYNTGLDNEAPAID